MMQDVGISLLAGAAGSGLTAGLLLYVLKNLQAGVMANTEAIGKLHHRINTVERTSSDCRAKQTDVQNSQDRKLNAIIHYLLATDSGEDPQAAKILEQATRRDN